MKFFLQEKLNEIQHRNSEVNWMQDITKIIAAAGLGTWYGIALLLMSTIVYKTISD